MTLPIYNNQRWPYILSHKWCQSRYSYSLLQSFIKIQATNILKMDKMKNFVFSSETIEYNFYLLRTNSPLNKCY